MVGLKCDVFLGLYQAKNDKKNYIKSLVKNGII